MPRSHAAHAHAHYHFAQVDTSASGITQGSEISLRQVSYLQMRELEAIAIGEARELATQLLGWTRKNRFGIDEEDNHGYLRRVFGWHELVGAMCELQGVLETDGKALVERLMYYRIIYSVPPRGKLAFATSALCSHEIYVQVFAARSVRPHEKLTRLTLSCSGQSKSLELLGSRKSLEVSADVVKLDCLPCTTSKNVLVHDVMSKLTFAITSTTKVTHHSLLVVPCDGASERYRGRNGGKQNEILAPVTDRKPRKYLSRIKGERWKRLGNTGIEVKLACVCLQRPIGRYATPLDSTPMEWVVWVEPISLSGVRRWLFSGGPNVLGHVVTPSVRGLGGTETKGTPVSMNPTTRGALFREVADSFPSKNVINCSMPPRQSRRTGVVQLKIYRRLETDLAETETLAAGEVRLCDVPVFPFGKIPTRAHVQKRQLTVRRKDGTANGTFEFRIWMQPTHFELPMLSRSRCMMISIVGVCCLAILLRYVGFMLVMIGTMPLGFCVLVACGPTALGKSLTFILARSVPGLNLRFGAIRIFPYISRNRLDHDHAVTEVILTIDIDEVRLANDETAGYAHDDFLSVKTLRLAFVIHFDLIRQALDAIILRKGQNRQLKREDSSNHSGKAIFRFSFWIEEAHERGEWHTKMQRSNRYRLKVEDASGCTEGCLCETQIALKRTSVKRAVRFPDMFVIRPPQVVSITAFCDDQRVGKSIDIDLTFVSTLKEIQLHFDKTLAAYGSVRRDPNESNALPRGSRIINWSPFPTEHDALRKVSDFTASRLLTLKVRELSLEGVTLSFDVARGELNVNRLGRLIAEGKVRRELRRTRKHAQMPNALRITVIRACGVPGADRQKLRVKVTARESVVKSCTQVSHHGEAVWNHTSTLPCPDPSAVIHVALYRNGSDLVGQWLVTAKMLVLAPKNVFGRALETSRSGNSYRLRGVMELRDKRFMRYKTKQKPPPELELELEWYYDSERGLSQDEMLAVKPLTALQQLQQNSLETQLKLGNIGLVMQMLDDFPISFDVRALDISHIRVNVKQLFMGYVEADIDDFIEVPKLDLRDKLKSSSGSSGITVGHLAKQFILSAILPVYREIDVVAASKHILAGVFKGFFSTAADLKASQGKGDDDDEDNDGGEGDEQDSKPAVALRTRNETCERLRFAYNTTIRVHRRSASSYLSWVDQEKLLVPAELEGLLLRQVGATSNSKSKRWSLVWCELRCSMFCYTKVQPNLQTRVGFSKAAQIDQGRVDLDSDRIVVHVGNAGAYKRIVLKDYGPIHALGPNPSLDRWHSALSKASHGSTFVPPVRDFSPTSVDDVGCLFSWNDTCFFRTGYVGYHFLPSNHTSTPTARGQRLDERAHFDYNPSDLANTLAHPDPAKGNAANEDEEDDAAHYDDEAGNYDDDDDFHFPRESGGTAARSAALVR